MYKYEDSSTNEGIDYDYLKEKLISEKKNRKSKGKKKKVPQRTFTLRFVISHVFLQVSSTKNMTTRELEDSYRNLYGKLPNINFSSEEERRYELIQELKTVFEMTSVSKESHLLACVKLDDEEQPVELPGEAESLFGLAYFPPSSRYDFELKYPSQKLRQFEPIIQIKTKKKDKLMSLVQAKIRHVQVPEDDSLYKESPKRIIPINEWIKNWANSDSDVSRSSFAVEVFPLDAERENEICNPYTGTAASWMKVNLILLRDPPINHDLSSFEPSCCSCCGDESNGFTNEYPVIPLSVERESCFNWSYEKNLKRKKIKKDSHLLIQLRY